MTAHSNDVYGLTDRVRYEFDDTLVYVSEELTSDTIIIPMQCQELVATLSVETGSGKIQTTNNKLEDVIAEDEGVVWVDWNLGTVTATTQDRCPCVTALRFVCTTGTVRLLLSGR